MKKSSFFANKVFTLTSALFVSFATPSLMAVDIFGPPATVDYQGVLKDSNGAPLGSAAPTNYEVQFRIYDAQVGGNIIWAETQIVTVSGGLFSVRLGEGDEVLGDGAVAEGSIGHDSPGLPGAFSGKERFLGVTVNIPGQTSAEISPRLSFLASPFSYVAARAQTADRVIQSASSEPSSLNVGSVSYVPLIVTSSGQLDGANSTVLANATTSEITTILPVLADKKEVTITKTDDSANAVIVQPPGTGKINGSTSALSLPLQGDSVTLRNVSGNDWWIASRHLVSLSESPNGSISVSGAVIARGGLPGADNVNGNGFTFNGTGDSDSGMFSNEDGIIKFLSNDTERLRVDTGGISVAGGATINGSLRAVGPVMARGGLVGGVDGYSFDTNGGDNDSGMFSDADGVVKILSNNSTRLQVDNGGVLVTGEATVTAGMAIGGGLTPDRRARLVVYGGLGKDNGAYAYYAKDGNGVWFGASGGTQTTGIYSANRVVAPEFNALSDARIKTIKGVSNSEQDLETLMAVEVTDYLYRDAVAKGTVPQKKLIAQQVEKVFPQAVSKSTDIVPDVMKKAAAKDGWILLKSDLKKGEKVRILADQSVDQVFEVLEVAEGKFRTTFNSEVKEVFVYGREVNDFRTVDYDAVAMLNVSASQKIKKDSDFAEDALRKENRELRDRLVLLEKQASDSEARLIALESAIFANSQTIAAPAGQVVVPVASK